MINRMKDQGTATGAAGEAAAEAIEEVTRIGDEEVSSGKVGGGQRSAIITGTTPNVPAEKLTPSPPIPAPFKSAGPPAGSRLPQQAGPQDIYDSFNRTFGGRK
jgi:hypothetical protein